MKSKLTALILTLLICAACLPLFSGCNAKTTYTLNVGEDGEKYYTLSVSGFTNKIKGTFEIPEYYGEGEDKAPVKEIADEGLSGTGITKLVIPKTVETIGVAAFAYNYSLKEVTFAGGSELNEIPRGAFGYCNALTEITIPQTVESIEPLAFVNCERLSSVAFPDNLKKIGDGAFEGCTKLESVSLPQTLEKIGNMAFYKTGLTEITIPDSVRDTETEKTGDDGKTITEIEYGIGYAAFHTCEKLVKATVGSGIKYLRSGVFGYCTALKEIYLPASLKKIEGAYYIDGKLECGHAFHSDKELADIYFAGSKAEWEAVEKDMEAVTVQNVTYDNSALTRAKLHYDVKY